MHRATINSRDPGVPRVNGSPYIPAAAAGLAWAAATPVHGRAILVLLGALAAAASIRGDWKKDAIAGAVVGGIWFGLALTWTIGAMDRFAGSAGIFVWLSITLLQTLPVVLAFGLWGAAIERGWSRPVAAGLAWAVAEGVGAWIQPIPAGPTLSMVDAPILLGPGALGGRPLLTAVLMGWAALTVRSIPWGLVSLSAWMLASTLWLVHLDRPGAVTTRVAVLQPDTGVFDGRRASTAEERARKLVRLAQRASSEHPDWIATPEGAWPLDPGTETGHGRRRFLASWLRSPPVVVGATVPTDGPPTNTLLALAGGELVDHYDKVTLLPIGERRFFGLGADRFTAGSGPRELEIAGVHVAPLICYEDALPQAVRDAQRGADVLLTATNDGWVGPVGAEHHLASTRMAALTTGRWAVRPALNGPSAVVDAAGRIRWRTTWVDGDLTPDGPGSWGLVEVALRRPLLTGAQVGPWLSVLALIALIASWRRR